MDHLHGWVFLLIALGLTIGLARRYRRLVPPRAAPSRLASARVWRPRTPQDCPGCRAEAAPSTPALPRPWAEVKSRRGAPKRHSTAGHACPSRACPYYGITDERVHALIGYGGHGTTDRIRDLRCQAYGTKVSARRGTALYRLKTPPARVGEVLGALAEGLDVAAAARVFGHGEVTIAGWLARAGRHAGRLHARLFRDLHLPHVQLDEIRTRLRPRGSTLWLWLAMDPVSKVIPVAQLGPRTQRTAHAVVHALRAMLAPTCVPIFTSDGLRLYFYALTAHFGVWAAHGRGRRWQVAPALLYGQVQKQYRRRRLKRVRYRILCGSPVASRAALRSLGLSGRVNTAFVERLNLTVRQGVAALARRTWSTAQTAVGLGLQVEWWRGYYHFVRPHQGLRCPRTRPWPPSRHLPRRYDMRTPAMAIGVTAHRWSTVELLGYPCVAAAD